MSGEKEITYHFKQMNQATIKRFIVVKIQYPDNTVHDGWIVLVFNLNDFVWLKSTDQVNPNFTEGKNSPVAKFPGTERGYGNAVKFACI